MIELTTETYMNIARVYAFGDSLITGTYDSRGGWFDRIKQDLHQITSQATDGTKYQAYNLGIGGETSRGLVARFTNELQTRHRAEWPAVVLIGVGKNDSRLDNGRPAVPLAEYAANLRTVITAAQQVAEAVLLVGIGPCQRDEVNFKTFTYGRAALKHYDETMSQVATECNVRKIDVFDTLLAQGDRVFYRDGLHLSDAGYQVLYDTIRPVLMETLAS
jgi:lysophospholipase L1-like esterase